MAALHGREDPLLVPDRFERFLRQANDAEVADVRKVGEGVYDVLLPRSARLHSQAQARQALPKEPVPIESTGELPLPVSVPSEPAAASAGRSATLRFRRGSRALPRPSEIPLVGVVAMHSSPPEAEAPPAAPAAEAKPARGRKRPAAKPKSGAKPDAAVAAVGAAASADAPSTPARRRGRGPRKR
jgi:hypothetical protein